MKVQHSIVNNNKLNTVPVVDGQVVYVKDTHDLYFDVDNTRTKATDIIFVGTLQERDAIQSPTPNKVYCVEENNKFYRYENNEWLQLGYEEQVPEIYYWNGTANQSGYNLWTNIFEVNKKLPVLVIWEQHNTTAKGTYSAYISIGELVNNRSVYGSLMTQSINGNGSYHNLYLKQLLTFTYNNGIVTNISSSTFNDVGYLSVNSQYANPYIPQYPGSPATKKYVDDSLAAYTPPAADVEFDNTGTGIEATTVEEAIVELNTKIGNLNTLIEEINGE